MTTPEEGNGGNVVQIVNPLEEIQTRIRRFATAMQASRIHVGLAVGHRATKCVTCRELWPCSHQMGGKAA